MRSAEEKLCSLVNANSSVLCLLVDALQNIYRILHASISGSGEQKKEVLFKDSGD